MISYHEVCLQELLSSCLTSATHLAKKMIMYDYDCNLPYTSALMELLGVARDSESLTKKNLAGVDTRI